MVQSFKLTYFNVTARAEITRLLFTVAGQEFTDERIEFSEWPALKSSGFAPFGSLPVLEVTNEDGTKYKLSQSLSIARFLGNKFNLNGKNEQEIAEVDMYSDQWNDIMNEFTSALFAPESDKQKKLAKFVDEQLPSTLAVMEKKISEGNSGFLVGNSLTRVDLFQTTVLEFICSKAPPVSGVVSLDILSKYPKVASIRDRVRAIPAVTEWNKSHNQ